MTHCSLPLNSSLGSRLITHPVLFSLCSRNVEFLVAVVQSLSCVRLFCDPMNSEACQAPLSMGFSRQEYWSGLPFLFSEFLTNSPKLSCSLHHICAHVFLFTAYFNCLSFSLYRENWMVSPVRTGTVLFIIPFLLQAYSRLSITICLNE